VSVVRRVLESEARKGLVLIKRVSLHSTGVADFYGSNCTGTIKILIKIYTHT